MQNKVEEPRILIADDDTDLLVALKHWLREYDSPDVITATNGADAIGAIDSTVNVFLCDRRMPKLTGDEVIHRLANEEYNVPTIVISAYEPDSHLPEEAVELYLEKPIDREKLFDALDHILAG